MIKSVPFFRPSIGELEIEAVAQALRSGWLTTGAATNEFEKDFTAFLEEPYVQSIAVNSATAALHLGLEAMGVGLGDEVIIPTLTFTATAEVVRYLGAVPIFVDIEAETLCIDIDAAEAAITPATKVIMPVHFAGRPCDLTRLRALADKYGLMILDDAAHALPAAHGGFPIGTNFSDATAFSFYANKTMTTGEGGMLVTRNSKIADRARIMRLHGIDRDVFKRFTDQKAAYLYDVVAPGYKYNLTDLASAIGRVQLTRLEEFHTKRRFIKSAYDERFADLPLKLPPEAAVGDTHSWHLYVVQIDPSAGMLRDDFARALQMRNVGISVHYRPLHLMTYWASIAKGYFPVAENYFKQCISLPLFMDMQDEEFDYVVDSVREIMK